MGECSLYPSCLVCPMESEVRIVLFLINRLFRVLRGGCPRTLGQCPNSYHMGPSSTQEELLPTTGELTGDKDSGVPQEQDSLQFLGGQGSLDPSMT